MIVDPEQNIAQLQLQVGMTVADLGAGTGFYSKAASAKVGQTGHVYAIEVRKDMVKKLESDIKEWGITNINCIWGDIEKVHGTNIADRSVDVVIISNVLFQVEDKLGLVDEAKRILKSDGRILLIDWKESFGNMGPITEQIVIPKKAEELFSRRGLKKLNNIPESDHHYGIIFILNNE